MFVSQRQGHAGNPGNFRDQVLFGSNIDQIGQCSLCFTQCADNLLGSELLAAHTYLSVFVPDYTSSLLKSGSVFARQIRQAFAAGVK